MAGFESMNAHSEFDRKQAAALAILQKSSIWRSNYFPPFLWLAWKVGLKLRPPHFGRFVQNVCGMGLYFTVIWGFAMWLMLWSRQGMPFVWAVTWSVLVGVVFGVLMGLYYVYSARKYNLPSWESL